MATILGPDLALADALATGLLAEGSAGLARIEAISRYEADVVTGKRSGRGPRD